MGQSQSAEGPAPAGTGDHAQGLGDSSPRLVEGKMLSHLELVDEEDVSTGSSSDFGKSSSDPVLHDEDISDLEEASERSPTSRVQRAQATSLLNQGQEESGHDAPPKEMSDPGAGPLSVRIATPVGATVAKGMRTQPLAGTAGASQTRLRALAVSMRNREWDDADFGLANWQLDKATAEWDAEHQAPVPQLRLPTKSEFVRSDKRWCTVSDPLRFCDDPEDDTTHETAAEDDRKYQAMGNDDALKASEER